MVMQRRVYSLVGYALKPNQDFFLKKLVNKITDPIKKKADSAIKKANPNSPLLKSTEKIQTGIIQDSPKGLVKGLALGATIATAGLASPVLSATKKSGSISQTQVPEVLTTLKDSGVANVVKNLPPEVKQFVAENVANAVLLPKTKASKEMENAILNAQANEQALQAGTPSMLSNINPLVIVGIIAALFALSFLIKK